jgi:hypothetical protein
MYGCISQNNSEELEYMMNIRKTEEFGYIKSLGKSNTPKNIFK